MGSISVGELKEILNQYDDNYEVIMELKHKYTINEETGRKGWIAYINGVGVDDMHREIKLFN